MTVYSHNTYESRQQQPEEAHQNQGIRVDADAGRTTSMTLRNGEAVFDQSSSSRVTSSELNPHHGSGNVFATAKSMHGMGVQEIKADTLLTINGVQAPAKFWEKEGVIHRGADGSYVEGAGQPQGAPQVPEGSPEVNPDQLTMTAETVQAVDQALEGVADQHLNPLVGVGISVATGELDRATLEEKLMNVSGASPEEAAARVTAVQAAFQAQADDAITSRCGVAADDLPGFYHWAKENHKGALRDAVQRQIHASDLSGYRALASRYLADMPPTVEAVKAGGFETRNDGGKAEVYMDGRWLTIAAAARLGLL